MRVFFDNCVSPNLARALDAFFAGRHQVEHLKDKFKDLIPPGHGLDDEVWLEDLGKESDEDCDERRWIVITEDHAILSKTARSGSVRAAWMKARLRTFFIPKCSKRPPMEQLILLLRQWDRILAYAENMDPRHPVIVPASGEKFKPLE